MNTGTQPKLVTVYNYATKIRKCSTTYVYRLIRDNKLPEGTRKVEIDGMTFIEIQ